MVKRLMRFTRFANHPNPGASTSGSPLTQELRITGERFFLLVSVPEETGTSIINIWSVRDLGSAG
jgi:hypothetical protein